MNFYNFYNNPKELNGYNDKVYHVPALAFEELKLRNGRYDDDVNKLVSTLAKSAEYSYRFAHEIENDAFLAGEAAIARSAQYSFEYAKYVLFGRFKKGEPAIIKNPEYAFEYAADVLQRRWKEAEASIAEDPEALENYCHFFEIDEDDLVK